MAKTERRRARGDQSALARLLATRMSDLIASGRTSQTLLDVVLKALRAKALAGDLPSLKELYKLYDQLEAERARLAPKEVRQTSGVLVVPQSAHSFVSWESLYGPSAQGISSKKGQ
jgi:hypothetical protein